MVVSLVPSLYPIFPSLPDRGGELRGFLMGDERHLLIVLGTRPEEIKLVPVIWALQRCEHRLSIYTCVTGQHREMLYPLLKLFGIKPHFDLHLMEENQSLYDISIKGLALLQPILRNLSPHLLLVQGDTTSAFIAALAAFYYKIPVGHVEGGLRSGDRYSPFPEEMNRRLISVLANLHFVPTPLARENLLKEGIDEDAIFITGNTVIDTLLATVDKGYQFPEKELQRIDFINKKVILVTSHRRENFGEGLRQICYAVREIAEENPMVEVVYPVHLNPQVRRPVFGILGLNPRIHLIEPLFYKSFVQLLDRSYLVLTDSGGVQEEAPSLGKPVILMRENTERPEGVVAGLVEVVGTDKEQIKRETNILLHDKDRYQQMAKVVNLYGDGRAGKRIAGIIMSRWSELVDGHSFGKQKFPFFIKEALHKLQ